MILFDERYHGPAAIDVVGSRCGPLRLLCSLTAYGTLIAWPVTVLHKAVASKRDRLGEMKPAWARAIAKEMPMSAARFRWVLGAFICALTMAVALLDLVHELAINRLRSRVGPHLISVQLPYGDMPSHS